MANTVGGNSHFVFDEILVAQGFVDYIGVAMDTLIIEFDHAAYEAFHRGPASPKNPTRSFKRICAPLRAPSANDVHHIIATSAC